MQDPGLYSFECIDELCLYIEMNGLLEGVFRVPGDKLESLEIVARCSHDGAPFCFVLHKKPEDPHSVASALKLYLRTRGECLFGEEAWKNIERFPASGDYMDQGASFLLERMPKQNQPCFRRLFNTLLIIMENTAITKMNAANLSMVLAPLMVNPRLLDIQKGLMANKKVAQILLYLLNTPELVLTSIPNKSSTVKIIGTLQPYTEMEKTKLTSMGKVYRYPKGEIILSRKLLPGFVYIVESGTIITKKENETGQTLSRGMVLDITRFLNSPVQFGLEIMTTSNCSVVEIPIPTFYAILHYDGLLQRKFIWQCASFLANFRFHLSEGDKTLIDKRTRRNAMAASSPMVRLLTNPSYSSSASSFIKVYTDVIGDGFSKVLSVTETDTFGTFKERCMEKFLICGNHVSYSFTLVTSKNGKLDLDPNMVIADHHPVHSLLSLSSILLLYLSLKTDPMLNEAIASSISEEGAFYEANPCKVKSINGSLFITKRSIVHISKDHCERLVLEMGKVSAVQMQKKKEILLTFTDRQSPILISASGEKLLSIYQWIKIIRGKESERFQSFVQSKNDVAQFLPDFPLRNASKPVDMYPFIIKEFINWIQNSLVPFYYATPEETATSSLHDFIMAQLYPILVKAEKKEKEENALAELRPTLSGKLKIRHFFPNLSKTQKKHVRTKLKEAACLLNKLEKIRIPTAILNHILRYSTILYDAMLHIDSKESQFFHLVILSVLQSSLECLPAKIAMVRRYVDADELRIGDYFVVQLEDAISFLQSQRCEELKLAKTKKNRLSATQTLLGSFGSDNELYNHLLEDLGLHEMVEKIVKKVEEETGHICAVGDPASSNYIFPRALVIGDYFPVSDDEVAFPKGAVLELYCNNACTQIRNPLALFDRPGYVFASFLGCFGWIPESSCRVVQETEMNMKFRKKGYSSLYLLPTTNDWFKVKKNTTTHKSFLKGDCIVQSGSIYQYLYVIESGSVKVQEEKNSFALLANNFFGFRSFLTGMPSTETVVVTSETATVLQFNPWEVRWSFGTRNTITWNRFLFFLACEQVEQLLTHYILETLNL